MPTLPRLLDVDLTGRGPWRTADWRARDGRGRRLAAWGGGGLSIALLADSEQADAPLVLSVGECVLRGVPTAARVSVASRSPLSGCLAEGLVGSDFGRRLAGVAGAVRIGGRCELEAAVLVIEADASAHVESVPEAKGLSSRATHPVLEARFGPCASLSIGPLGERGARIASLAASSSRTAGGGVPHFVGRGGLGAVLGRLGLKAIVVRASAPSADRSPELTQALTSSPRLEERARGGTLEMAHAMAAREDVGAGLQDAAQARHFAQGAEAAREHQHGCLGCPTPCGWVFRRSDGAGQAARFGASHALGLQLGFSDFDGALALLARCDELGLDAKEVGAGFALLCELEPGARGRPEVFARWLEEAAAGTGPAAALVDGVQALAEARGLSATTVRRCSVRADKNLASLLGQCVSARGSDPMRAFPFLAAESASLAQLRELCAPLALPDGAEDPFDPRAKGRLVGWHEDLVLALDLTGFCAFSASALLSDRLADLDRLARWIAPAALREDPDFASRPGKVLLAAGAELARAQREWNQRWGWRPADDVPAWAAARLAVAGMEPEYRAYREDRAAFLSSAGVARSEPAAPPSQRARGTVHLRAFGSLGAALGVDCAMELDLPASAADVVRAAAARHPEAADALVREGAPLPALYRAGARLEPETLVRAGETIDLLLVVGGG